MQSALYSQGIVIQLNMLRCGVNFLQGKVAQS